MYDGARMRTHMIDLSLILPCFNESPIFDRSVRQILHILKRSSYTYEIIFVDDASRDNTAHKITRMCKRNSTCRALFHARNEGRGKTVSDGIRTAKGRVCGYIDIDCEVSPVYIPDMVEQILRRKADIVIGRRMYRTSPGSILREILSVGYQKLSNYIVGTGGFDSESGYKFFNRKKILPLLPRAHHPHWFWDTEIIVFAMRADLIIKEVPVLFVRRFDKVSSVNIFRDSMDYLVSLIKLRVRLSYGRI